MRRHLVEENAPDDRADRGALALVLAVLVLSMFAFAGLVLDGGAALAARGQASDLAQQAARAGAGAVSPSSLRTAEPQDLRLDPSAATAAARRVLDIGRAQGAVSVGGSEVTVTARVERRTVILAAFGIPSVSGTATASATLLYGTTTGTPVGAP